MNCLKGYLLDIFFVPKTYWISSMRMVIFRKNKTIFVIIMYIVLHESNEKHVVNYGVTKKILNSVILHEINNYLNKNKIKILL